MATAPVAPPPPQPARRHGCRPICQQPRALGRAAGPWRPYRVRRRPAGPPPSASSQLAPDSDSHLQASPTGTPTAGPSTQERSGLPSRSPAGPLAFCDRALGRAGHMLWLAVRRAVVLGEPAGAPTAAAAAYAIAVSPVKASSPAGNSRGRGRGRCDRPPRPRCAVAPMPRPLPPRLPVARRYQAWRSRMSTRMRGRVM